MSEFHLSDALIVEYLEGNLDPGNIAEIERHRTTCETCAAKLATFERLFNELENLP